VQPWMGKFSKDQQLEDWNDNSNHCSAHLASGFFCYSTYNIVEVVRVQDPQPGFQFKYLRLSLRQRLSNRVWFHSKG